MRTTEAGRKATKRRGYATNSTLAGISPIAQIRQRRTELT